MGASRALCIAGLVAIVPLSWLAAAAHGTFLPFVGVLSVAAVVWLTITGFFGYGDARRSDWVGLIPFVIALAIRELWALHSVQEIEVQFERGPIGRHSVVYPLLQMFFTPLVRDPHRFTMHMNGVLGALACLSLYLFVRQRLASRRAGFLCALFLATHPLVARFSPTDGPYALILASWFSGLALLSAPRVDGWGLLGGALLVGMAATARMEGSLFLIASLLMLDQRALIAAARRHRGFAVAGFVAVYLQVAVQMVVLLPNYITEVRKDPTIVPVPLHWLYESMLTAEPYNSDVLPILIAIAAVAGLLPRLRLGLTATLAMVLVMLPIAGSWMYGSALHKMIPTYALQALAAGVGAYTFAAWLSESNRWSWLPVIPGVAAAFFILVQGRAELTKPYLFTEEYDLVRSRLVPGGIPETECSLFTLNVDFVGDIDMHDFRQVARGVDVLDCRREDCLGALARGGCFYYVRSAACYYHVDGVPPECVYTGMTADGDRVACLNPTSRAFEQALQLEPVEVRTINIAESFQDRIRYSPITAEIALFRVRAPERQAVAVAPSATAARPFAMRHEKGMPLPAVVPAGDQPSVPAGQDALLLAMLGGSNLLAGDCKLDHASSDQGKVEATYNCPSGQVVVELAHTTRALATSIRTAQFALTPVRGEAPGPLLDNLQTLIRAREAEFQWDMLPPPRRSPAIVPLAISGAIGVLVLVLVLRRRPGRRTVLGPESRLPS